MPSLRQLILEGTDISDEGLAHLAKANGLNDLRVKNTKVTQAGVDRLKQVLPRCVVSWNDPNDE